MCLAIGWDKQRNHQINMMRETFRGSFQESAWTTSCMNLSLSWSKKAPLSILVSSANCPTLIVLSAVAAWKLSVHLEL